MVKIQRSHFREGALVTLKHDDIRPSFSCMTSCTGCERKLCSGRSLGMCWILEYDGQEGYWSMMVRKDIGV